MKPPSNPLQKHTLFLRSGDFQFLMEHFPRLSASRVVRKIVSNFVDKLDQPVADSEIEDILKDETLVDEGD